MHPILLSRIQIWDSPPVAGGAVDTFLSETLSPAAGTLPGSLATSLMPPPWSLLPTYCVFGIFPKELGFLLFLLALRLFFLVLFFIYHLYLIQLKNHFLKTNFGVILDSQKNRKDSKENFLTCFTQTLLMLHPPSPECGSSSARAIATEYHGCMAYFHSSKVRMLAQLGS